jgi:hypothetical protein
MTRLRFARTVDGNRIGERLTSAMLERLQVLADA